MREYGVTLPMAGSITVYVKAENEEQALEKAGEAGFSIDIKGLGGSDVQLGDDLEVFTRPVNRGNVCYFPVPEPIVEET